MDKCIKKVQMQERLQAFTVATKILKTDKRRGAGYFILILDLINRVISPVKFDKTKLEEATQYYDEQEEKYKNQNSIDVVMVSASSLRELKKAYPNYFADTSVFQKNIETVYKSN